MPMDSSHRAINFTEKAQESVSVTVLRFEASRIAL